MLRTRLTRLKPTVLAQCRALARELEGLKAARTAAEEELLPALWTVVTLGPNVERVLAANQLIAAAKLDS